MSTQAAGGVDIVLKVNEKPAVMGFTAAGRAAEKMGASAKAAGHTTVTSMQAASASIRLLENPLGNNTRAIERLLSQSKLLSGVMQSAFPIVGAVAMATIIVDLGKKVYDFSQSAKNSLSNVKQGFEALNDSTRRSGIELDVANDKLANTIAKLEHKPENLLALALDEDRKAAFALTEEANRASKTIDELLKKNSIGAFKQLGLQILGTSVSQTTGSDSVISSAFADLQISNRRADQALDQAKPGNETAAKAADRTARLSAITGAIDKVSTELGKVYEAQRKDAAAVAATKDSPYAYKGIDFSNQTSSLETALDQLKGEKHNLVSGYKESDQTTTAAALDEQKAEQQRAKEAAKEAARARKEAAAELVKGWEVDAELFKKWRDYEAENTKISGEDYRDREKGNFLSSDANTQLNQAGAGSLARITALRQSIDANKQNSDVIAQQAIQMGVATGQLTKLDAARRQAAIHTEEYTDALQKLQEQAEYIKGDKSYTSEEARQAALTNNQTAQGQLNVNRQIQVGQDNQSTNPAATSGLVGAKNALDEFVTASQDAAKQMQELATNTLRGLNDTILHVLTTPHMTGRQTRIAFGDYGAGLARSVAGTALEKGEGSILGGLGFGGGKLGTQSNPMIVRFADGTSGAIGSAGGFLSGLFGSKGPGQSGLNTALGISSSAASDDAGGGIGTIASALTDTIPFLASGGPIDGPAVVGEQGPELFNPGTSGTIIPNHKLKNMGGSGTTIHIDASGSTDPAQTRVQVMRGIQQAAPHISASAINAQRESNRRRPPSARRY